MFGPPPSPPNPPKPGSRPAPAPLVSVAGRAGRSDAADGPAVSRSSVLPSTRPFSILRPRSCRAFDRAACSRSIGANLIAYTQKPSVNLAVPLPAPCSWPRLRARDRAQGAARSRDVLDCGAGRKVAECQVPVVRQRALTQRHRRAVGLRIAHCPSLPLAPPQRFGSSCEQNCRIELVSHCDTRVSLCRPIIVPTSEERLRLAVRNPGSGLRRTA